MKNLSILFRQKNKCFAKYNIAYLSTFKNKDKNSESDKSYSGTDTKHIYGSDRVIKDVDSKVITKSVNDEQTHKDIHPNKKSCKEKDTQNNTKPNN
jgi:hypothetical protein